MNKITEFKIDMNENIFIVDVYEDLENKDSDMVSSNGINFLKYKAVHKDSEVSLEITYIDTNKAIDDIFKPIFTVVLNKLYGISSRNT